jgi:hypothetical protein
MRRRTFILTLAALFGLLSASGVSLAAQGDEPVWTGGASFPGGIYIQTGHGTIPPGATDLGVTNRGVEVGQTTTSSDSSFRRVLKLSDGRAIFYEVSIRPLEDRTKFEVRLKSVSPTPAQVKEWGIDPARVETNFLKNYSAPLMVNKGDILAIDVLINPRTGVKLIDYYRISNSPLVPELNPKSFPAHARAFKAEDIELLVLKYEIRVNGETVYKSAGGFGGRFIWIDIPRVGRFLFSLAQEEAEAAGFQPTAYVSKHQIVFTHAGNRYEVVAEQPIVPGTGVYYLWMQHDPTFTVLTEDFPKGAGSLEANGEPGEYGRGGAADNFTPLKKRE